MLLFDCLDLTVSRLTSKHCTELTCTWLSCALKPILSPPAIHYGTQVPLCRYVYTSLHLRSSLAEAQVKDPQPPGKLLSPLVQGWHTHTHPFTWKGWHANSEVSRLRGDLGRTLKTAKLTVMMVMKTISTKAWSRMIASNEIRFKKLALPCMTARTPLDMIATDCRKDTIQLTLQQAAQPTPLHLEGVTC